MAKPTQEQAQLAVAPRRNDPKKVEIYKHSRASQLQGRDPAFRYELFSTDPSNPKYFGKYTGRHEAGHNGVALVEVEGWEFVRNPNEVKGTDRDDQGSQLDGVIKRGSTVLMKLPVEEHAKYAAVHDLYCDAVENAGRKTSEKSEVDGASVGGGIRKGEVNPNYVLE